MDITIKTIPHADQCYDTVGNWWINKTGGLEIRVSSMGNWRYEQLVAVHELTEALLCSARGITAATVDAFDKAFEAVRSPGNTDEPGDDPACPYRQEHFFATSIERLLAQKIGVDWFLYDRVVRSL